MFQAILKTYFVPKYSESFFNSESSVPEFSHRVEYSLATKFINNKIFIFLKKFLMRIHFLRDREQMIEGQKESETQNLKQAAGSVVSAQSPVAQTHKLWDHDPSWVRHLTNWATKCPNNKIFLNTASYYCLQDFFFQIWWHSFCKIW